MFLYRAAVQGYRITCTVGLHKADPQSIPHMAEYITHPAMYLKVEFLQFERVRAAQTTKNKSFGRSRPDVFSIDAPFGVCLRTGRQKNHSHKSSEGGVCCPFPYTYFY